MIFLITSERSLVKQSGEAYPPHQTWQTVHPAAQHHNADWQITIPHVCGVRITTRWSCPLWNWAQLRGNCKVSLKKVKRFLKECVKDVLAGWIEKEEQTGNWLLGVCVSIWKDACVTDRCFLGKCQLSDALSVHCGYPEGFVHGDSGVHHCLISNKGHWNNALVEICMGSSAWWRFILDLFPQLMLISCLQWIHQTPTEQHSVSKNTLVVIKFTL